MKQIARPLPPTMTADEFFVWPGDGSGRTFGLVDGKLRPVSPALRAHGAIQQRLSVLLDRAIEDARLPLEIVLEGAIVPGINPSFNVRVPDVVVTAMPDEERQMATPEPVLLIEVISAGDAKDTRNNVDSYLTPSSVQEVVIVDSTKVRVEILRRDEIGVWKAPEIILRGGRLRLSSIRLDVAVEDVYRRTWIAKAEA